MLKLISLLLFVTVFTLVVSNYNEVSVSSFSKKSSVHSQLSTQNSKHILVSEISKNESTEPCQSDFRIGQHYFEFAGGMRFNSGNFGDGNITYATPVIAVDNKKVWIGGQTNKNIIGAFELVFTATRKVSDMPIAKNVVPFKRVDSIKGWPQHKRLSGIDKVNDNILIGLTEYYDADGNAPFSHVVLSEDGKLKGWYKTNAVKIAHASGWISPLPDKWSKYLNAKYLLGHTENYPIASRHSIGPSLYTWDGVIAPVMTVTPYLFYNLKNPLHKLRYNRSDVLLGTGKATSIPTEASTNNLWTVESQAWGGFIIGDDYIVIGASGMHNSSGGYKITDKNGTKCGGPCAFDPNDYYNHYWVYDMNEIISADKPWDPKPYEWGELHLGFAEELISGSNSNGLIKGVDYDDNYLYLSLKNGDVSRQSERLPLLLRYKLCTK